MADRWAWAAATAALPLAFTAPLLFSGMNLASIVGVDTMRRAEPIWAVAPLTAGAAIAGVGWIVAAVAPSAFRSSLVLGGVFGALLFAGFGVWSEGELVLAALTQPGLPGWVILAGSVRFGWATLVAGSVATLALGSRAGVRVVVVASLLAQAGGLFLLMQGWRELWGFSWVWGDPAAWDVHGVVTAAFLLAWQVALAGAAVGAWFGAPSGISAGGR